LWFNQLPAPAGFAAGLRAAGFLALFRFAAGFLAAGLAAAVERLLAAVARFALAFGFAAAVFLAGDLRALLPDDALDGAAVGASSVHLPDNTRCAASATASAISDPSLVALFMTALAACEALSAASMPASRMARRAFGLALIAAAAAARPAASISRLIAALATLSIVLFELEREPDEDFLLLLAFAIANLPLQMIQRHFRHVTVPRAQAIRCCKICKSPAGQNRDRYVKGHRCVSQRCPSTWSAAEGDGRPLSNQSLRTPLSDLPAEP
jgi:hypothetical protein